MEITINNKTVELKYSIRSLMMYENIMDKSFGLYTTNDVITFFYCIYVTSAKDYSLQFDDFIDAIDENPNIIAEFSKWIETIDKNNNAIKKN